MPIYPPRNEPIKKKDQLLQRQKELRHVLGTTQPADKLTKAIEKYRNAQLSLLKAKVHEFQERQYQGKSQLSDLENLEKEIHIWTNKTTEEIIQDFNNEL
jgi:hypothetical protein